MKIRNASSTRNEKKDEEKVRVYVWRRRMQSYDRFSHTRQVLSARQHDASFEGKLPTWMHMWSSRIRSVNCATTTAMIKTSERVYSRPFHVGRNLHCFEFVLSALQGSS
jgi:hypothetical protein